MSNQMWGGRFTSGPDAIMEEINASIGFDYRLARQDIAGSKAHVAMLAKTGIVSQADADAIAKGLDEVAAEIESGKLVFSRALEDIHMNVESRLAELIGPVAGRLHTARSRNDQVALDFKLWVRDTIDELDGQLRDLQQALVEKAATYAEAVMPGFTHLQSAQPVTFGHHLLAYVEMFSRDRGRFRDARARLNECPLGAAALGRHVVSDRPRRRRRARSASTARPPIRSTASPTAISCSKPWRPPPSRRRTCRGSPKKSCCGRRRNSASSLCPTNSPPARRSCRRSAIPTRRSWCAASPAASSAISPAC